MKKGCFNLMLAAILSLALAGTAYAFKSDFHGKMWQVVGVTDNYGAMAGPQKSGNTDFFSYNGSLNIGSMKPGMYDVMSDNDDALFGITKARLRCLTKRSNHWARTFQHYSTSVRGLLCR